MIAAHSQSDLDRMQRILRAETRTPRHLNTDTIHGLAATRSLAIGRQWYRVPPISYEDGLDLYRLAIRLRALQRNAGEQGAADSAEWAQRYGEALADGVAIAARLLIPTNGWRRWAWKLFGYRHTRTDRWTEQEIVEVLGFLAQCRTSGPSRVRFTEAPRRRR